MASQIYAQYFQGVPPILAFGTVSVGNVFVYRGFPAAQGTTNPAPTPFLSSYVAPTAWGVQGTSYTVTAVTPDPAGSGGTNVGGVQSSSPGDTVTLSGGIGVINASGLMAAYLLH